MAVVHGRGWVRYHDDIWTSKALNCLSGVYTLLGNHCQVLKCDGDDGQIDQRIVILPGSCPLGTRKVDCI